MKQHYEFLGIISGKLAENEVEPVIKKITDFFIVDGAEIAFKEYMGRRRFAYPIKNMRYGFYFTINFDGERSILPTIEKKLLLEENLVRYLITKTSPKTREEREKEKIKLQTKNKENKESKSKETSENKNSTGKVSMDELDKKLNEILDDKI